MASIPSISGEATEFSTPIVMGCNIEVAERFAALPANQTLYLPSLPPSFHAGSIDAPRSATCPATSDSIYFVLPIQPLNPEKGYVFSRSANNADFQLPEEVPPTTSVMDFRIIINEHLEWTLVDESLTGISVNSMNLHSMENQNFLASTGYRLSNPKSQIPLHTEQPNAIRVGWGALQFDLYVLCKAADYYHYHYQYHPLVQPSQSTLFSPTPSQPSLQPPQPSQYLAATHLLKTTDDVDAELDRQAGGDLAKGFYIDPARFPKAAARCQPSAAAGSGGDVDVRSDDQERTLLADLGQLNLRGEDGGFDLMES